MLRRARRFGTWAFVAFAFVCALAFAGCKPMVFDGPPQSRKEQLAIGACAAVLIVLGLTQVPSAVREYRLERELQREIQRRRAAQQGAT